MTGRRAEAGGYCGLTSTHRPSVRCLRGCAATSGGCATAAGPAAATRAGSRPRSRTAAGPARGRSRSGRFRHSARTSGYPC
ncbi:hypothetical protein G6F46_015588 [Rhizopus delemar]|nr:hypothetical protein G6F46_015588 [Rhizopus delemar]